MKKTALYSSAGSALALALLAWSLPASADVFVHATITKDKDIVIDETINITKTVDLDAQADNLHYAAAAEADAIVNQEASENTVDHSRTQLDAGLESIDLVNFGIDLDATINGSILGNTGIVDVNQDVGNMSNQGNQVALAIATPHGPTAAEGDPEHVVINSQSEADQINRGNSVRDLEDPRSTPTAPFPTSPVTSYPDNPDSQNKSASILGSINGNTGIVNVNQNAGNMNNQANSEAIAVAINLAGVALSEAALGQVNTNPDATAVVAGPADVFEAGVNKTANLAGSLNGNTGVGGVNQAAGNMANQANIFSLSFIDGGSGVGLR